MDFFGHLNIWTLLVCSTFGSLLYAYAFFRIWGTHPSLRGAGSFALAFLVNSIAGAFVTFLPDTSPKPTFFNTALGDSLAFVSLAFLLIGIGQFFGTRRPIPIAWLLVLVGFAFNIYFTSFHDSLNARLLINGVGNTIFRSLIGVELLRQPRRKHVRTLSGVVLFYAALSLISVCDLLAHPVTGDATQWLLKSQGVQSIAMFLLFIFIITVGQLLFLLLNGELVREIEAEATRDFLTDTLNRRGAGRTLTAEILRAQRAGTPLTVSLVDLDHFKRINDTLGHAEGDNALTFVASAIKKSIRATDSVGRFGGDEFIVLFPNAASEDVHAVMQRVHQETAAFPGSVPVTLSVGIASLAPTDTASTLLARVDKALYDAKQSGRNCTRLHTLDSAGPSAILDPVAL
jgi:diguanylate cyclase (GGDEF)-like protein